jgi:hypothetical protein
LLHVQLPFQSSRSNPTHGAYLPAYSHFCKPLSSCTLNGFGMQTGKDFLQSIEGILFRLVAAAHTPSDGRIQATHPTHPTQIQQLQHQQTEMAVAIEPNNTAFPSIDLRK